MLIQDIRGTIKCGNSEHENAIEILLNRLSPSSARPRQGRYSLRRRCQSICEPVVEIAILPGGGLSEQDECKDG